MPFSATTQGRKFGPATSTIRLTQRGGAVLAGIWITAKGSAPNISVHDSASTAPAAGQLLIGSTVPAALGLLDFKNVEMGTGLVIKVASCTGTIFFRPGQTP